jgi:integrase
MIRAARAVRHVEPASPADDPVGAGLAVRSFIAQGDGGPDDQHEAALDDVADAVAAKHGMGAAYAFKRAAQGLSTPLDHYVTDWLAEAAYQPRSNVQHKGTIAELGRWCSVAKVAPEIEAITRQTAGRFLSDAAKTQKRQTVARKLSTLRAYWGWMVARGHLKADPWLGQTLGKSRLPDPDEAVREFTDTELAKLLAGGADAVLADFIRIGALTGARLESIARLRVRHCQDGAFDIRRDKTRAGTRKVPIHSQLVPLIAARCAGKGLDDYLFTLRETTAGSRSASISKRFRTYRIGLGIDDVRDGRRGSLVNFHSLRHWFVTAALRAGQPDHVVQQVVGHAAESLARRVYFGGDTLETLRACVETVRLPGASSRRC